MYLDASPSGFIAVARDPAQPAPGWGDALPGFMRLDALPDERVTPLALAGDREAWNVLIKRHERGVLVRLLARGVRVDRAKDILQDTWARLIEQQREGRLDRLELPGLAIAQAMYLAMEEARRQARNLPIEEAPEVALLSDPRPSIEERLTSRADLDRAVDELGRCSPQARRIFAMVYDEPGTPQAEAAKAVGISVQRVRQSLCEVRARLRAAMERSDEPS
jgi:RNA polymerase sigma-70 factor (ECF subfamily)